MVVRSKRILSTPLPVILHLHSCGECGLGTVVGSLDQGSQYWTSKEYRVVKSVLSGCWIGKGDKNLQTSFLLLYIL